MTGFITVMSWVKYGFLEENLEIKSLRKDFVSGTVKLSYLELHTDYIFVELDPEIFQVIMNQNQNSLLVTIPHQGMGPGLRR